MQYGLLEGLKSVTDYILGGHKVPFIEFIENGDWSAFLPKYEPQAENYETSGCTVWGAQNQIEIFHKGIYGTEPNYSERFTYLLANVDPARGQDPQVTYEAIRKNGLIDHNLMPVTKTLDEFVDKDDLTGSLLAKGQNWLRKYELKHEWLWDSRPADALEIMKRALVSSPLGVSVTAWWPQNGVYIDNNLKNNHWCVCYKIDDRGIHVFDSYDHSQKILALDHKIASAKRIWLNRKNLSGSKKQVSVLQAILNVLMQKQTFLEICEAHLGVDASPKDIVSDDVACAETVATLLNKYDGKTPLITGTWTLNEYLKKTYKTVTEPLPGDIIMSPTGTGKYGTIGHVGVVMGDGTIASNDSRTGLFVKNYSMETWKRRYHETQGMPIIIYRIT